MVTAAFASTPGLPVADAEDQAADAHARSSPASAAIVATPSNAGFAGLFRSETE